LNKAQMLARDYQQLQKLATYQPCAFCWIQGQTYTPGVAMQCAHLRSQIARVM
jgi:hypothetical protein